MSGEGPADAPAKKSVFRRAVKAPAQSNENREGETKQPTAPVTVAPMAQFAVPVRLPGTKASVFSKNSITSSGLASLDSALGGGVALGTVVCITEDAPSSCHSLLLKHFLAQGLVQGHDTLVAAPNTQHFLPLPAPMKTAAAAPATKTSMPKKEDSEELRIAWRYKESLQGARAPPPDPQDTFCLKLDMSQPLSADLAAKITLASLSSSLSSSSSEPPSSSAAAAATPPSSSTPHASSSPAIPAEARPDGAVAVPDGEREACAVWDSALDGVYGAIEAAVRRASANVLRIALPSFGDTHWVIAAGGRGKEAEKGGCGPALLSFLKRVRGLVRGRNCVVLLTLPPHLAAHAQMAGRVERSADMVLQLKSLAQCPPEVRAQLKEYSATLHVAKALRLSSLGTFTPDVRHYLVRVRRKLLQLDRLQASTPEAAPTGADPLAF